MATEEGDEKEKRVKVQAGDGGGVGEVGGRGTHLY